MGKEKRPKTKKERPFYRKSNRHKGGLEVERTEEQEMSEGSIYNAECGKI